MKIGALNFNFEMKMVPTCFEGAPIRELIAEAECAVAVAACAGTMLSIIMKKSVARRMVLFCQRSEVSHSRLTGGARLLNTCGDTDTPITGASKENPGRDYGQRVFDFSKSRKMMGAVLRERLAPSARANLGGCEINSEMPFQIGECKVGEFVIVFIHDIEPVAPE